MSQKTADAFAPAKINLTLHVTGQRADGYHLLDSLVVFADVGDRVSLTASDRTALTVSGPNAAGIPTDARNLVWQALTLAGATAQAHIIKELPSAAGIGGGSSDAAATLRALSKLTGAPMPGNVAELGADLPVCLLARACRMQGTGEHLTPLAVPAFDAVLVNPHRGLSTPDVFRALEIKTNLPMPVDLPEGTEPEVWIRWLATMRNDLETPARSLEPAVGDCLTALSDAALARMSGSGATCFGLYEDATAANTAAARISADHPDWWVRQTRLN